MPLVDKLALQRAVVESMSVQGRYPFRGQLALDVAFLTSARDPTHMPQLGKNLIDLLAAPLPGLAIGRRGVMYYDDRQIDALSVTCRHNGQPLNEDAEPKEAGWFGEETRRGPRISLTAVRHSIFVEDLATGAEAERVLGEDDDEVDRSSEAADEYQRMQSEADREELTCGPDWPPIFRELAAQRAQEDVLGRSRFSLAALSLLHGAPPPLPGLLQRRRSDLRESTRQSLMDAPTRIWLDELPSRPGTSDAFREMVDDRLEAFWRKWQWLFGERLRVPIALEVLIKPPRAAGPDAINDLDNVVRNYLARPLIERLQPPADMAFAYDPEQLQGNDGAIPSWLKRVYQRIPRSVRVGLTRYEAWRLRRSPEDFEPGFVSVGLAPDPAGIYTVMNRVDYFVDTWAERLRDYRRS